MLRTNRRTKTTGRPSPQSNRPGPESSCRRLVEDAPSYQDGHPGHSEKRVMKCTSMQEALTKHPLNVMPMGDVFSDQEI